MMWIPPKGIPINALVVLNTKDPKKKPVNTKMNGSDLLCGVWKV